MSVLTTGLVQTVDLIEVTPSDSGYGTVALSEATVATNVSVRFTTLEGMQEDHPHGRGADNLWKVIAHVDIIQDRLLEQTSTFLLKDTTSDIRYRVVKVKSQFNELGEIHHVSLIVKQDRVAE